jgi:hypothetical protein
MELGRVVLVLLAEEHRWWDAALQVGGRGARNLQQTAA